MREQEVRELYEAYMQVYDEAYVPWDFGPRDKAKEKHAQLAARKEAGGSSPGTATRANRIASVGREMRTTLDKNSAATGTNPAKQGLQPATSRHTAAALRGAGGGMTATKTYDVKPLKPASKGPKGGGSSAQGVGSSSGTTGRFQVGGGQGYGISGIKLANSFDPFDIVMGYLLDEGYADTNEAAFAIMANMSEEWRQSIVEGGINFSVPSRIDDFNNRRDELKNRYKQDVGPRIPGPGGGGQYGEPSAPKATGVRLARGSSSSNRGTETKNNA